MSQSDSAAQAATVEPRFFPEFCFVAPEEGLPASGSMSSIFYSAVMPANSNQMAPFRTPYFRISSTPPGNWSAVAACGTHASVEGALCASFRSYTDLVNDDKVQRKLDWIARRKGQFERSFNRSVKEMKVLKAEELKQQPPQPTFTAMSPEQLKAEAQKIIARRKTKISEQTQSESAHAYGLFDFEPDAANLTK